ncbi:MAG: thioesterase [Chloroflexi bacterium]|nr:thioesterase [Chloroflexota bacterium]
MLGCTVLIGEIFHALQNRTEVVARYGEMTGQSLTNTLGPSRARHSPDPGDRLQAKPLAEPGSLCNTPLPMSTLPFDSGDLAHWMARPEPLPDPAVRLICFPYAGGGVAQYLPWRALLPPRVELCAWKLPGRESRLREPPATRLTALAAMLAQTLLPLTDRPFAFFGHSLGALVAFETAQSLRRAGLPMPEWLFVSGRAAPHIVSTAPPIHQLPPAAFVAEIVRRYDGIPRAVLAEPALLRLLLPTLRADLAMLETYHYAQETPLPCPISVFGGRQDQHTPIPSLQEWQRQTCNTFRVETFPGGHFYLQTERTALVDTLTRDLTPLLEQP